MKITDVKTVMLTGPMTNDPSKPAARRFRSAAFIEIHTDTEHVGIGETYLGYQFPEVVPIVVDFFKPIICAAENLDIHTLRQRMFDCCAYWGRVGIGPTVISGIEAALWDLKGKLYGLPVYELLGGRCHDRLPAYATGGVSNWPLDRLFAKVDHYLELGFTGFKVGAGYFEESTQTMNPPMGASETAEFEAKKVAALRDHVGKDVRILLDGHMGFRHGAAQWDLPTAQKVLAAVEPYDLFFFEEPLPYTDPHGYGELCRTSAVRVAGGESLTSFEEFRQFADAESFDIAQPDSAWIGMTDFLDVGRRFALQHKWVASHAWGSGSAVMQNIHAAFATPNTLILEMPPAAGPLHTEVWGDSLQMNDGFVLAPTTPGLGVHLTDELKAKYPFVPGTGEFVSVPGKILER
ncbi:MAG TPA: mandelate racemase/muconate lactonizing enzyme family protein [Thermomicrobiales bacterium]|nr:mandelate racemase/muconate lactonizing enzyme family protein [Thermomicrobiales bacterium]